MASQTMCHPEVPAAPVCGEVDAYGLAQNLAGCLQCGKCTGACPVARVSPSFNPRQIIRDILMGERERWLASEEIWRCFWCAGCYTLCPAGIHFPLLIMQVRYRALEQGHGLRYAAVFKRFALRALEEGLTFTPGGPKGRERIMALRRRLGLSPWPEISAKARAEYRALFDLTGTTAALRALPDDEGGALDLTYLPGRITGA